MGDLKTCPPEQFFEILHQCSLGEKRAMLESLVEDRSERSMFILGEILQGDSWYLRDLAVRAIPPMGDIAVPTLMVLLRSGLWYSRAAAARALGRIGYKEGLPDLVHLLSDPNHTVRAACLKSIADLVRGGMAKETARLFWNQGAHRANELSRVLLSTHHDSGRAVAEFLADPDQLLREDPPVETPSESELPQADRKNA